ncbi:HlyD family efflux transporter periplasmic adaptor subunit [Planctomycetales bacterium 10988]|nr:HlyD family efflux transporter periplasmic adaptor subunit [Planctomycetales bacterium 10988]
MLNFILALALTLFAQVTPGENYVTLDSVQVTLIEEVNIPAREAGVLTELNVKEGDLVQAGDRLGRIDDSQVIVQLKASEADLVLAEEQAQNTVPIEVAEKGFKVATAEYQRGLEAIEKYRKSISETEIDRLKFTMERAELEIEQAKHEKRQAELNVNIKKVEIEAAKIAIERRQIVSPVEGMVVERFVQQGEWVNPGRENPVCRILRLDRLRVEGFLNAQQYGSDVLGKPVRLITNLPGKPETEFEGEIVFVSPEVEPVTGQFRIWAEINNESLQLRPGMSGNLVIDLTGKDNDVAAAQ